MIKISKRLEAIASLVPSGSNIIDIGCDHGLLDIFLHQNKISNKIIASDVNINALDMAKQNIKKNNLIDKIEIRLGNGLDVITEKDHINTVILAGIGAHTIIEILEQNINKLEKIDNIIIGSNTKIEFLRRKVTKMNYMIEDELMLEDNNKIYTIIKFKKGNQKYTKKELYFGPILLKTKTKVFKKNLTQELEKMKRIMKIIPNKKIIQKMKVYRKIKMYKKIISST